MILNDKTYDACKYIAIHVIPALETLVLAIGLIWNIEICPAIGATIGALGTCLGTCIGMSKAAYEKARKEEYEGPEAAEDHE